MSDPRIALIDNTRLQTALTGYATQPTQALLAALRAALLAGLPVNEMLRAKRLETVSYGLDPVQVDGLLALLADPTAPVAAPYPEVPVAAPVPQPQVDELLAKLRGAKFRLTHRIAPGYAANDVDTVLDQVEEALAAGQSLAFLKSTRFRIAKRRETGYEPADVDQLLDVLIAGDPVKTSNPEHNTSTIKQQPAVGPWQKFLAWLGLAK